MLTYQGARGTVRVLYARGTAWARARGTVRA